MNWEIKKLEECCVSIADGDHMPPPKSDSGVPFVTIANVDSYNHFDFSNTMYVPQAYYDKLDNKRKATCGDVLLTVVGSFGIPILISDSTPFVFQRHIAILRPNADVIDSRFLYYTMLSKAFFAQADTYAIGAAQRTISLTSLRRMKISVPPMAVQNKIADVLSVFDVLIENNNKRIKVLEQMAESLYKEWFVRFRFPGYENAEFENDFPKSWQVSRIKTCVKRLPFNRLYKAHELDKNGSVIVIDQSSAEYLGFHNNKPSHYADYDKPIILFGDHSCKFVLMCMDFSLGENVIPFISNNDEEINTFYLYYSVHKLISTEEYKRHWSRLINMKILVPPIELQNCYAEKVSTIKMEINNLKKANRNLTKQRDMLLPRLMSGKLEV